MREQENRQTSLFLLTICILFYVVIWEKPGQTKLIPRPLDWRMSWISVFPGIEFYTTQQTCSPELVSLAHAGCPALAVISRTGPSTQCHPFISSVSSHPVPLLNSLLHWTLPPASMSLLLSQLWVSELIELLLGDNCTLFSWSARSLIDWLVLPEKNLQNIHGRFISSHRLGLRIKNIMKRENFSLSVFPRL